MDRAREEDEKELEELRTQVREDENRIQNIQSTAFQLANYYFVFQGVILTAICNGTTSLKCSDRWFLFTVSLLAASLNLVALGFIGHKYIRTMSQRDRNWSQCNEITRRLQTDYHQQPSLHDQTQPPSSASPSYLSARPFFSPSPPPSPPTPTNPPRTPFVDRFKELERYFWFSVCMLLFLGFAGVTLTGCWRFLCKDDHESQGMPMDVHNCIRFCAGGGCIKICDYY